MEERGDDRISVLPYCLLVEILSRLPSTKYAIRTGFMGAHLGMFWSLEVRSEVATSDLEWRRVGMHESPYRWYSASHMGRLDELLEDRLELDELKEQLGELDEDGLELDELEEQLGE
uniref:Uncharacterized protein n=1 Tax=Lactuca sativa TaxID=4236 RepID=A0A9R1V515_LACSA|nr:hypothetical protein LSAT_V11C700352370 [Lactuca sativa]